MNKVNKMPAMDYDSTTKFITSLAKFLQSLCSGYVDFNNWVQINGHLILSVDSGETKEFVVNEKLCRTIRDNVSFLSNSYHAPMNNGPMSIGSGVVGQNNNLIKPVSKPSNEDKVVPTKGRGRKQAQPQKLSQDTSSCSIKKVKQCITNNSLPTFIENDIPDAPLKQQEELSTSCPSPVQHSTTERNESSESAVVEDQHYQNDSDVWNNNSKSSSDKDPVSEILDYSTSSKVQGDSTSIKLQDDFTSSKVQDDTISNKEQDDFASKNNSDDSISNEIPKYSTCSLVMDYTTSGKVNDDSVDKVIKDSRISHVNEHSASKNILGDSETDEADTDENDTDTLKQNSHSNDSGSSSNSDTNCLSQDYIPVTAIPSPVPKTVLNLDNKPVFPGLQTNIIGPTLFLNDTFCQPPLPFVPPQLLGAGLRLPPGLNIPGFGTLPQGQSDVNQIPFTVPFGGLANSLKVKLPFPTKASNIRQPSCKRKKQGRPLGRKHQIQSDKISTSTSKSNDNLADIAIKEEIEELDDSISPLSMSEIDDFTAVKRMKQSSSRSNGDGMDDDGTPKTRHNEPLSAHAVTIMSDWFYDNVESPYPSRAEMMTMAREGGIEIKQVKSWFANKRNRTNNTKPKVQVRAMEEKLMEVCQDLQMRSPQAADNSQILLKLSEVMSNLNTQKE